MEKNVASQKVACFAWDNAAGVAKTGDSGNLSGQISIDGGTPAAVNGSFSELESTDLPGVYMLTLTQAESNGSLIIIAPKSSTADIDIRPLIIYTVVKTGYTIATGGIVAASFAANAITAAAVASDVTDEIWAKVIETNDSITAQQAMSLLLAVCVGITTTEGSVFKDPGGNSTRVTATIDADQNRTAMSVIPSS